MCGTDYESQYSEYSDYKDVGMAWQEFTLKLIKIVGLLALAGMIALGKVEEKTSFGLSGVLAILGAGNLMDSVVVKKDKNGDL